MNRHHVYGLEIASELELPEFPPSSDPGSDADVLVRLGDVPAHLDEVSGRGVLFEANRDEFLLHIPEVASYLVREGREIIVDPNEGVDHHQVRVFMLGSGLGALLHQRELLVLHAAAIGTSKGAVLFAGPSGHGKSTLLGEMLNRGHAMMVDDVCAVTAADGGGTTVLAGYPRTRIWSDAATQLDVNTDVLVRTRPSLEKFERQVDTQFWAEPAAFRTLYVLGMQDDDSVEIEPLSAVDAFSAVLHNTYRHTFMDGLEMRRTHFALASEVAAKTKIARVRRPRAGYRLRELADAIEADLEQP